METNLMRVKERLEKETAAHLETKQHISELEYRASELDRQVNCERGERHRLERLVSSGSLPDDAKVNENLYQSCKRSVRLVIQTVWWEVLLKYSS
jgi:dishevelled associated activator of morphogenesis